MVRRSGDAEFIRASRARASETSSHTVSVNSHAAILPKVHVDNARVLSEKNFFFIGMLHHNRDVSRNLAFGKPGCWSCTSGSWFRTSISYQQAAEIEDRRPCLACPSSAKADCMFRVVTEAIEFLADV